MADEQVAKALLNAIGQALAYRDKHLEARSEWGSISFEKASLDFKRIFEILSHLSVLPLASLTDSAVTQIGNEVMAVAEKLGHVDAFNIESQTPTVTRDTLVTEVHSCADSLYTAASQWIPFLAYQKGDVAKNIEALTASVGQAQTLIEGTKETIEARQAEIETIITQAREASAAAGAAVFTQDFSNEAKHLEKQALWWLGFTAGLAFLTLAFAVLVWLVPIPGNEMSSIIQRFGGKVAVLVVLFTAALWCGKSYKALKHLATINRHRALSLQTFQAFSHAASENPVKDAVLMEATRAIFGAVPTGFLDGKSGGEQDLKIVEIVRALSSRSGAA